MPAGADRYVTAVTYGTDPSFPRVWKGHLVDGTDMGLQTKIYVANNPRLATGTPPNYYIDATAAGWTGWCYRQGPNTYNYLGRRS